MKFFKFPLACAALALALPLAAQDETTVQTSAENAAAIDRAEYLGEKIYRYDQAAWHTTDAMLQELPDPAGAGVRGWIVNEVGEEAGGGLEAVFYRPTGDGFEAAWSGRYDGKNVSGTKTYAAGERALTESEVAMVIALDAPFGVETGYSLCSERLNRVVFPTGKEDGGHFVYLLAPQPAADQIPFGGHFRFEVVDGEVVDHRRFTNSCLTMAPEQQDGSELAMFMISHVLDPTPTEIHVFSMFAGGIPVAVMTTDNDLLWAVEAAGGKAEISIMERD